MTPLPPEIMALVDTAHESVTKALAAERSRYRSIELTRAVGALEDLRAAVRQ